MVEGMNDFSSPLLLVFVPVHKEINKNGNSTSSFSYVMPSWEFLIIWAAICLWISYNYIYKYRGTKIVSNCMLCWDHMTFHRYATAHLILYQNTMDNLFSSTQHKWREWQNCWSRGSDWWWLIWKSTTQEKEAAEICWSAGYQYPKD